MNKYKNFTLVVFLILPLLGFVTTDRDIYYDISKSIEIFGKVYREISLNYVDQIFPERFMQSGIEGMLEVLDPYSVFIDESMQKDFDIITNGKYGGIGASVGLRNGQVTIIEIMDDYPAQKQGLKVGDIIKKVNGIQISKDNFSELGEQISGVPGKEIEIFIQREGMEDLIKFNIILEEITVKNISYYGFYPKESNNIYVKLSNFSRGAGQEVKSAILELSKQRPINSVILDLRDNPGGLLEEAIDVAEKFLSKKKLIVSVAGRDTTKVIKYFSKEEPLLPNIPLLVLANENSASASEIVIGAIQDHDAGIIVGDTTFGKGLVQTIIPISAKASLKLTTARYFTPSGRCIQKIDYSENKKAIKNYSIYNSTSYFTDNHRQVFSNGGITPDSLVLNYDDEEIIKNLQAEGLIFRFVNNFVNKRTDIIPNLKEDDLLFNEFVNYLEKNKYNYSSAALNLSEKLLEKISKQKKYNFLIKDISGIKEKIQMIEKQSLKENKQIVVYTLKKEIASRLKDRDLRYSIKLARDNQFETAFGLTLNSFQYNRLLNR